MKMVTLLCLMWTLNLPGISVAMDILHQWTSLLIAKLALIVTLVEEQTSMKKNVPSLMSDQDKEMVIITNLLVTKKVMVLKYNDRA